MNIFSELKPPTVIFETDSKYNGHIKIIEVGRTRKMVVDGVIQSVNWDSPSCGKLYWGKTIEVLKEAAPDMQTFMILGLGGGTLVHLVSKAFPAVNMISVDVDQVAYDLAKKYFDIDSVPNHKVIISDAMKVVIEPETFGIVPGTIDCLMVDIYIGQNYPDLGKSGNFISAIKKLVKPGGLIVFNRIYIESHQEDVNTFINYIEEFLTDVKCKVVAGYTNSDNVLIYGRV